jgi:hypothetical protein
MHSKKACHTGLWILIPAFVWLACGKHHSVSDDDYDTIKPVLTITLPVQNQSYKSGDSVKLKGTLTDNSLHDFQWTIVQNSNNAVLYQADISVHDYTSYTIDLGWKSSVTAATDARVIAWAIDHGNHVVTDTIGIHINP